MKTLEQFEASTGLITTWPQLVAIFDALPKPLKKSCFDHFEQDTCKTQADSFSQILLKKVLALRPDLHVITTVDSDDGDAIVYFNSMCRVNRIDFYLATGNKDENLFYVEKFDE